MTEAAPPPPTASGRPARAARARARLTHPVGTTALVGLVVAVLNVWWVARHRTLGAFNVDEAGYIANGLRLERLLFGGAIPEFVTTAGAPAPTGPLVPVLSVPVIAVFGRSATAVMFTQCLISVAVAMVGAGIVGALADRRAARAAGLVLLVAPALLQSARGFQYASAAAACLGAALWALLRSDRAHDRRAMLAFGVAVGAMMLARTMAVAFVPGAAVAALVVMRRDRRAVVNVSLSALAAVLVAGPWWIASRDALYDWLFALGYGPESEGWGSTGLGDRVRFRVENLVADFRVLTVAGLVIAVLGTAVLVLRRAGRLPSVASDPNRARSWGAVLAAVAISYVVLLTTRHQGTWFELPLEVLLVAAAIAAIGAVVQPLRRALEVGLVALCLLTLGSSLTDRGGELASGLRDPSEVQRVQEHYFGGLIDKERVLSLADPAFFSNDRARRSGAAARWWDANLEIARRLDTERDAVDGDLFVLMSGSSHLVNSQSIALAHEVLGEGAPPTEIPDTAAPRRELAPFLEPTTADGAMRVIVLIRSTTEPFPDDRDVPRLRRLALDAGWREDGSIELPDGGDVLFLRYAA